MKYFHFLGSVQTWPVPVSDFRWADPNKLEWLKNNIENYRKDQAYGVILEVDLEYPNSPCPEDPTVLIHRRDRDYPLLHNNRELSFNELGEFSQNLLGKHNLRSVKNRKFKRMFSELRDQENYIIHILNLQVK